MHGTAYSARNKNISICLTLYCLLCVQQGKTKSSMPWTFVTYIGDLKLKKFKTTFWSPIVVCA